MTFFNLKEFIMWQLVEIIDGRYVVFSVHLYKDVNEAFDEVEKYTKWHDNKRNITAILLVV